MNYYVYKHMKLNGDIFYIGMGKNKRAYQTRGRSDIWTNYYNKYGRVVEIVKDDLTEQEAKDLEVELIKFYGKKSDGGLLVNIGDGGDYIWNRDLPKEQQPMYGKKISQEQKDIISDYMIINNPMKNLEVRNKMINSKIGVKWKKDHKRIKFIEVMKDDMIIGFYHGINHVVDKLGLNYQSVANVLSGRGLSLKGYKIKYI